MSEAKKRIWVSSEGLVFGFDAKACTPYVRADIVKELVNSLVDAHAIFKAYETYHVNRGATEKAERNARYAMDIENALFNLEDK